jgi:hypothetical protein
MSISTLERVVRETTKIEDLTAKSDAMLSSRAITPAEHRSLQSLSWQIAANVEAGKGDGSLSVIKPDGINWL